MITRFSSESFTAKIKGRLRKLRSVKDRKTALKKVAKFIFIDKSEKKGLGKIYTELKKADKIKPIQFKQRVADYLKWEEVKKIKKKFEGEKYRWLPSQSENPDPEHALLYGKVFTVGASGSKGGAKPRDPKDTEYKMPSEDYGCNCGFQIIKK